MYSGNDATSGAGLRKKLSVTEKVSYGFGGLVDQIMSGTFGQLAFPIYNIGLGLDARLLGIALAIPRFIDAITDPMMGHISDNTRSRWGRRKPYIALGALLMALSLVLVFSPPADLLASDQGWGAINALHKKRQQAWDNTEAALLRGGVEYMIVHPEGVADAEIADGRMKIGFGSYHTLVMPQLDFIPLAVMRQLKQFEQSGGKVIWVDCVPRGAEHMKNDEAVKAALDNAQPIPAGQLAGSIAESYSPAFDLAFTPGTDQMMVGRFHRDGKQVYLLVNRLQNPISIEMKGAGNATVLDPSTGEITLLALPAKLSADASRALMVIAAP